MILEKNESCKQWLYLIHSAGVNTELKINSEDIILNADGEIDVPLEIVLKKYNMSIKDLFAMNVDEVDLIEVRDDDIKILHSISFKYLRYYHSCS